MTACEGFSANVPPLTGHQLSMNTPSHLVHLLEAYICIFSPFLSSAVLLPWFFQSPTTSTSHLEHSTCQDYCGHSLISIATKGLIFISILTKPLVVTSDKLVENVNYLSWSTSVELRFVGQGYEDHLVTQDAKIPETDCARWKKIDAQLCTVLWQSIDFKILHHLQT